MATGRERARKAQLVFAIHAGLDVTYVMAGGIMWELGRGQSPRVTGYGQALVLQGSFLFAFDVAMMWAHEILLERHRLGEARLRSRPLRATQLRPSIGRLPDGSPSFGLSLRW